MAGVHTEVPDDIFQRAKMLSIRANMFFKAWIAQAIQEKVQRDERKGAK